MPSVSLPELILRGSMMYLTIFALMRFLLKREAGTLNIPDLLMVVLIADAAQNAMSSEYHSLTEGLVLVATIIFWNYALDWVAHRFAWFERIVHPPPLLLVEDGVMLRRNMRRELVTEEELMAQTRQQGVEHLHKVKKAYMEGSGRISVITTDEQSRGQQSDKQSAT